jgi:hypothetical protein
MWLRRFGATTRRTDWAPAVPSILAARMAGAVAMQEVEDFSLPQTREILVCEAGALGNDACPGVMLLHNGITIELENGPTPLPSDRGWEYWTVIV